MTCQTVEQQQGAYLDGELNLDDALALEAHVATCAVCAARIEADRELSRTLRAAPYFKAPAELISAVGGQDTAARPATARPRRLWAGWAVPLASAAVLVLAAAGGYRWRAGVLGGATRDAVVASHVRALMGDHLLDVPSTDRHTVKPWFAGRLEFSPAVPDLANEGFPLVGGRLDYVDGHAAAALVYKRGGHVIDVFTWPTSASDSAPQKSADARGYALINWRSRGFVWWAVSDVASTELDAFVAALMRAAEPQRE